MEEIKLPERCDQCPNHCPAESLLCGRGRAHFERLKRGETEFHSEIPLVNLLVECGGIAKHKSEMLRMHGVDESNVFGSSLSEEEQAQLLALLQKQKAAWDREHAERHRSGHHGPRGGHGMGPSAEEH